MLFRNLFGKKTLLTVLVAGASMYGSANSAVKGELESRVRPTDPRESRVEFVAPFKAPVLKSKVLGVNGTADIVLTTIDSLQNAYSFYSMGTQPFVYDSASHKYLYVQRGSSANTGADYHGNLILRTSPDGATWSNGILVYDNVVNSGYSARYPSVAGLSYGDTSYAIISNPTLNGTADFNGVSMTVYNLTTGNISAYYHNAGFADKYGVTDFTWTTDSKILTKKTADKKIVMAISHTDAATTEGYRSGFAGRYSEDLSNFSVIQPDGWSSSLFASIEQIPSASLGVFSDLVGSAQAGGAMYVAVNGLFADEINYVLPGYSKSTDNGATWSTIEHPSKDIFNAFFASSTEYENETDSFSLDYNSKGFTVLDNGDIYFTARIRGIKDGSYVYPMAIEIFKENGVWGVRKIGELTNYCWIPCDASNMYSTSTSGSIYFAATDCEMQLARTMDGQYLLAKYLYSWPVPYYDADLDETLYVAQGYEIVAKRKIGESNWVSSYLTAPQISDVQYYSDIVPSFNKLLFLPDRVPNNLENVPFLIIKPKMDDMSESATSVDTLFRQCMMEKPQYVCSGKFNFNDLDLLPTAVKEDAVVNTNISIANITPNPVYNNDAYITLNIANSADLKIELFDMLGNRINTAFSGSRGNGTFSFPLSTQNLANGAYNVVVTANGFRASKQLSIVR